MAEYVILTTIREHLHTEREIDSVEGIVVCGVVELEDEGHHVGGVRGRWPAERQPLGAVSGGAIGGAAAARHRRVVRHIQQEVVDARWNKEKNN